MANTYGSDGRCHPYSDLLRTRSPAFRSNHVVLSSLLKSCSLFMDIKLGNALHGQAAKLGHVACQLVSKALLNVYSKCGCMTESLKLFDEARHVDSVVWNILLSGFSGAEAMRLFHEMHKGGNPEPNAITMAILLPVCARRGDTYAGKSVHCYAIKSGLGYDPLVGNALISFYSRCGLLFPDAHAAFFGIECRDVISWNAMITGYSENDSAGNALSLFHLMLKGPVIPNWITLVSVLTACSSMKDHGREVHCYVQKRVELREHVSVNNALLSFYFESGLVEEGEALFVRMNTRDIVSWNTLIRGYISSGENTRALKSFSTLARSNTVNPDAVTIITLLSACSDSDLTTGKELHGYVLRHHLRGGYVSRPTQSNALMSFYARSGDRTSALRVFSGMFDKDVVSWNTILSAFENGLEFLDLIRRMMREGPKPDSITLTSVIRFCINSSRSNGVREAHCYLIKRGMIGEPLNLSLLIRAYAENDRRRESVSLFRDSQSDRRGNRRAVMSIVSLCVRTASIDALRQVHGRVVRSCMDDVYVTGSLLDGYSKCGCLTGASSLFRLSGFKDTIMFTAMIGGYAMHGMGKEAVRTYRDMIGSGLEADEVTLIAVLSACRHAGMVEEGKEIFRSSGRFSVRLYGAVVDLVARGGRLDDAYQMVRGMPTRESADVWAVLLGACVVQQELQLGRCAAQNVVIAGSDEEKEEDIGKYVTMSNLFATNGMWDSVVRVRSLMRMRSLRKPIACSWIELRGTIDTFLAGDFSHPERESVYSALATMHILMKTPFSVRGLPS